MSSLILPPRLVRSEPSITGASDDARQSRVLLVPDRSFRAKDGAVYTRRQNCDIAFDDPDFGTVRAYAFIRDDGLNLLAGSEPTLHSRQFLLHVSISRAECDPTWEEIKSVREAFFPDDVDAIMVLPRAEHYVNVHQHCFHLHQIPREWGMM